MQFLQACIKIRNPQIIQFLFQLFIACVCTHFSLFRRRTDEGFRGGFGVLNIGNILAVHQMPVVEGFYGLWIFAQGMPVNVPEAFRLLYKTAGFA